MHTVTVSRACVREAEVGAHEGTKPGRAVNLSRRTVVCTRLPFMRVVPGCRDVQDIALLGIAEGDVENDVREGSRGEGICRMVGEQ